MERLTYLNNGKPAFMFNGCEYKINVSSRLYAYEETGLTPEEIKALKIDNDRLHRLIDELENDLRKENENESL